jgi:hypothetical protein
VRNRRLIPWGILLGLMLLTAGAIGLAIADHGVGEIRVSMLKPSEMPGTWHPIKSPPIDVSSVCADHTSAFAQSSIHQRTAFVGPGGVTFIEAFRLSGDPAAVFKSQTNALGECAKLGTIQLTDGKSIQVHRLGATRLIGVYVFTGSGDDVPVTEYVGIALVQQGIVEAVVARPTVTSSALVRVTGSLVLQAILQADPHAVSGLPHHRLDIGTGAL